MLCSGEDVLAARLDADESDAIRLVPKDRVCVRVRLAGEPVKTLQHCIERDCLCGEKKRSGGATRSKRKPRKHTPKSKRKRRKTQHSVKKVNFLAFCPDSFHPISEYKYYHVRFQRLDLPPTMAPTLRLQPTNASLPPRPPPVVGTPIQSPWLDSVERLRSKLSPSAMEKNERQRPLTAWDRLQLLKVLCDELCSSSRVRGALATRAQRKQELVSDLQQDVVRLRQMTKVAILLWIDLDTHKLKINPTNLLV